MTISLATPIIETIMEPNQQSAELQRPKGILVGGGGGDVDIIKLVYDYRLLRINDVEALIGRKYKRLHPRFKGMFDQGFLGRLERPWEKDVYYVRRKGLSLLLREGLITDDDAARRVRTGDIKSRDHIEHELMISDIHLLLTLASRTVPIELVAWKQGREIGHSFMATVDGGEQEIRIEPDAFFQIRETEGPEGQRQIRSFLLEADRLTMPKKERPGSRRMDEKVRKYLNYIALEQAQQHEFLKRLNVKYVRILTVTLTGRRRDSLAKSAAELLSQGYRKYFFFGSLEDLPTTNPAAMFDPVFLRPGEAQPQRSLLPAVAEKQSHA